MTRTQGERAPVDHAHVAVGVNPVWYTVAFQGRDGLYYPVTMKGQGCCPMYDDIEVASAAMRSARNQGIDATILSFTIGDPLIEEDPS